MNPNRSKSLAVTAMTLAALSGIGFQPAILKRRIEALRPKLGDEQAKAAAQAKRDRKAARLQKTGL